MAVLSKPSKFAFSTEGDSLVEPEHKDSCDINRMIRDAHRGLQVRGGKKPVFGYDDTTLDAVQFRIQKAETEQYLKDLANEQLDEDELKHIPESIKKKFGFKAKKAQQKPAQNNDDLNDDDQGVTEPQTGPKPKSQKTSTGGTPPVRKASDSAQGDQSPKS